MQEALVTSLSFSLTPCQCGNMAREGLRTLVVGKKVLSEEQYTTFEVRIHMTLCVCACAIDNMLTVLHELQYLYFNYYTPLLSCFLLRDL